MRKKYKIGLTTIAALLILVSAIGVLKVFIKNEEKKPSSTAKIISNISDYGYTLDDRDTKYMKSTFSELESILNAEEIDEKEYAQALTKLFIIDFYTLNNKINKYDVGSLEYILNNKKDQFKAKAMDTIYSDVIDNTYKDRVQNLPEITNVEIENIEETTMELNKTEVSCYKVAVNFTYKEDLGYDKEGTVYLVKNNNKLEIALYNPEIEKTNNQ